MVIPPITYAFVAALAFSGLNASVGYLTIIMDIPVVQVILIRSSFDFILVISYAMINRVEDAPLGRPAVRKYMLVTGMGVAISVMTGYYSMSYLTLSEFTTMRCFDPFATALLCRLFLKERFTKTQLYCCLLSVFGIILVADPLGRVDIYPGGEQGPTSEPSGHLSTDLVSKLVGILISIPSIFGEAAELTSMRMIGDQASAAQVIIYLALCPALVAIGFLTTTMTALVGPITMSGWMILLGVVPLGFIGQYALTYAGQRVSGTQVSIVMYLGVVSGTLLQWLIYGDHPSWTAFVGMAIIVICGIYAAVHGPDIEIEVAAQEADMNSVEDFQLPLLARTESQH